MGAIPIIQHTANNLDTVEKFSVVPLLMFSGLCIVIAIMLHLMVLEDNRYGNQSEFKHLRREE